MNHLAGTFLLTEIEFQKNSEIPAMIPNQVGTTIVPEPFGKSIGFALE